MSHRPARVLDGLGGLILAVLNVAVVTFYATWFAADAAAINKMETSTSVDPSVMLPNSSLMWVAAHASLIALLALDAVVAAKVVGARRTCAVTRGNAVASKAKEFAASD